VFTTAPAPAYAPGPVTNVPSSKIRSTLASAAADAAFENDVVNGSPVSGSRRSTTVVRARRWGEAEEDSGGAGTGAADTG
jgi:hypothetical protein